MKPAGGGPDAEHNWEGFVRPAGLFDGPLEVQPERRRYYCFGSTPVSGRVQLTFFGADGQSATGTLRVRLAAGYGWNAGTRRESPTAARGAPDRTASLGPRLRR